jgi:uncharacterized membrane protein YdjX (TVP38/TMEM64 family)
VGVLFLCGAGVLGVGSETAARQWLAAARGPAALPAAVAMFAALAFLGVPQFVLIAAAVAVFGPRMGAAYSWIGTMVSALVGFGLGRGFGARLLHDVSGPRLERFMGLVARNGFMASLLVRLAPLAPFVLVNMAAGAAGIGWLGFTAGTAIGIAPKILLTAFAGVAAARALAGGGLAPILLLVLAALVWLGLGVLAARRLRR